MNTVAKCDDEKYLDLLAIFHYILGGITALFACFPLIHVAMGLAIVFAPSTGSNCPPPNLFGWIFVFMGGIFVLCGWALAVAIIIAGRKLNQRKSRTYCIVVGATECIFIPFGTILGVFTLIVLMKESAAELFSEKTRPTTNELNSQPDDE